jgi:hypothetical protein
VTRGRACPPGDSHELQIDRGWENRRLILASLAPRTATRPARRGAVADVDGDLTGEPAATKTPGLLTRGIRASGRAAAAGVRERVARR